MNTTSTRLVDHKERTHALLSASKSERWINCTPSARMEEEYGEDAPSAYASEGTTAHELAETILSYRVLDKISYQQFHERMQEIKQNEYYAEEMSTYVPLYTEYCAKCYKYAMESDKFALMEIEQKIDLREYVPGGFGTVDCSIIGGNTLGIIDLKYGKGVRVMAEHNSQLMLYALGALRKYDGLYDIQSVRMAIAQVRLNNIDTFTLSVEELYDWAENVLRPAAKLAFDGGGELNAGGWCRFCSVRNRCRRLYEREMELAKYEFKKPDMLTDEEVSDIILRSSEFTTWINGVKEYAEGKAVNENKSWPGLKLVEGISRRKWSDEDKAEEEILDKFPELNSEDIYSLKLKSITEIEKLVGRKEFTNKLSDIVVKPQGKPTLVSEDDKRPALGIQQAIADFQ